MGTTGTGPAARRYPPRAEIRAPHHRGIGPAGEGAVRLARLRNAGRPGEAGLPIAGLVIRTDGPPAAAVQADAYRPARSHRPFGHRVPADAGDGGLPPAPGPLAGAGVAGPATARDAVRGGARPRDRGRIAGTASPVVRAGDPG